MALDAAAADIEEKKEGRMKGECKCVLVVLERL